MARLPLAEVQQIAQRLSLLEISPDEVEGMDLDPEDRQLVYDWGLAMLHDRLAHERRAKLGSAQRKALRLLRSFLTPAQRETLARSRSFVVTVRSGRSYRFHPNTGACHRIERHGRRWYAVGMYCYHEELDDLAPGPETAGILMVRAIPPADRTIGQMLLLLADEDRFLAEANWTALRPNHGWDSAWMTRRAAIRRQARELAADQGIEYEAAMDMVLGISVQRAVIRRRTEAA